MAATVRMALLGVLAAFAAMLVRRHSPGAAAACAMAGGALVLLGAVGALSGVVDGLAALGGQAGAGYAFAAARLLGVSYICQIAAQTCRDAGEEGLGQKVELAGKLTLAAMTVPVLSSLVDIVGEMCG